MTSVKDLSAENLTNEIHECDIDGRDVVRVGLTDQLRLESGGRGGGVAAVGRQEVIALPTQPTQAQPRGLKLEKGLLLGADSFPGNKAKTKKMYYHTLSL